jgi:hypothetical protein
LAAYTNPSQTPTQCLRQWVANISQIVEAGSCCQPFQMLASSRKVTSRAIPIRHDYPVDRVAIRTLAIRTSEAGRFCFLLSPEPACYGVFGLLDQGLNLILPAL